MADLRRGFSSVWTDGEQIERLLPVVAQSGFDGIEPTFNSGAFPSPEEYRSQAPELRRRCVDLGLAIPSMRGGRRFWDTIPSSEARERGEAVEHLKRAAECLALLGGRTLLVVPGRMRPDVSYSDHWRRVVDFAHQGAAIARDNGVVIGFENVEARFPLSVRDWADLIDEIAEPEIGVYFDAGNVLWLGLGYPHQWIEALAGRIFQIHFKDAVFGADLRNLLEGEIEWPAVMAALRRISYAGWISVEPEWYRYAPQRLPQRLLRDLDAILAM